MKHTFICLIAGLSLFTVVGCAAHDDSGYYDARFGSAEDQNFCHGVAEGATGIDRSPTRSYDSPVPRNVRRQRHYREVFASCMHERGHSIY